MLRVWTNTSSTLDRTSEDEFIKENTAHIVREFPAILESAASQGFDLPCALSARPELVCEVLDDLGPLLSRMTKLSRETQDPAWLNVEFRFLDKSVVLTAKTDRKTMSVSAKSEVEKPDIDSAILIGTADLEVALNFVSKTFGKSRYQLLGDYTPEGSLKFLYMAAYGVEIANGVINDKGHEEADTKVKACVIMMPKSKSTEVYDRVVIPEYEEHMTATIKKASKWVLRSKPDYIALESRSGVLGVKFLGDGAQPVFANFGSPVMLNGEQIAGSAILNSLSGRFVAEFIATSKDDITLHFGNRDENPIILEDSISRLSLNPMYDQALTGTEMFIKKIGNKIVVDANPETPKVEQPKKERKSHRVNDTEQQLELDTTNNGIPTILGEERAVIVPNALPAGEHPVGSSLPEQLPAGTGGGLRSEQPESLDTLHGTTDQPGSNPGHDGIHGCTYTPGNDVRSPIECSVSETSGVPTGVLLPNSQGTGGVPTGVLLPNSQGTGGVPTGVLLPNSQGTGGDGADLQTCVRTLQEALSAIADRTHELLDRIDTTNKLLHPRKRRPKTTSGKILAGDGQSEFIRVLSRYIGETVTSAIVREHSSISSAVVNALVSRFTKLGFITKVSRGVSAVPLDFIARLTEYGWTPEEDIHAEVPPAVTA